MLRWIAKMLQADRSGGRANAPARGERIDARMREAYALHEQGRLEAAADAYRAILREQPRNADALYLLGEIALQRGDPDGAIEHIERAIALAASVASFHFSLGCALQNAGRLEAAIRSYRRALELDPAHAEACNNLGNALKAQGQLDAAIDCYRQAASLRPGLLGAYWNWGEALKGRGRLEEAIGVYRAALAQDPASTESLIKLGSTLVLVGRPEEALEHFRRIVQISPERAAGHLNLGAAYKILGGLDEAVACFERAVSVEPELADAHNNLGSVLLESGRVGEAEARFRRALELDPRKVNAHSNLLLAMHYRHDSDPQQVFREHLRWAERHAAGPCMEGAARARDAEPERRLRIGYVSPDFMRHSVAYFLQPVLQAHDRERFEIVCYSNAPKGDEVTRRLRQLSDRWHDIFGRDDAEVAAMIERHKTDILVDLAGHTGGGRPLLFARRPAPVQVSWLGYPDTSGLAAMDYRLTDADADPEGQTEDLYTEQLVRLGHGFLCYGPSPDSPEPSEPPAARTGRVTFGCFNNLAKVTPEMAALWAQLLAAAPGARLVMKAHGLASGNARRALQERFSALGVESGRVELLGPEYSHARHLARYADVDIGLDTYPYHGTTTTCEALWMGVPVVTLAGRAHVSRVGVSILSRVGFAELVAATPADYVNKALGLAGNVARLRELRAGLRDRMRASPLLDAPGFTRALEAAYRGMWRRWCESGIGSSRAAGRARPSWLPD
jgi:predicted O-linked N-acetylglucosamine transferase (SPINDLY family)